MSTFVFNTALDIPAAVQLLEFLARPEHAGERKLDYQRVSNVSNESIAFPHDKAVTHTFSLGDGTHAVTYNGKEIQVDVRPISVTKTDTGHRKSMKIVEVIAIRFVPP